MAIGREALQQLALHHAQRAKVDPQLFSRLITQESAWNPNAVSPVGAFGLTQAMPGTWSSPGFGITPGGNRNDPNEQLRLGADYISSMLNRYGGDPVRAAAAYNWGPGNVDKWSGNLADLPAETRNYVQKVALADGGAPDISFGDIASGPNVMSLVDEQGQQSNSPVTLADLEEEYTPGNAFHPGLALQSLGAAISAGSQGQSASDALGSIRQAYFDERQSDFEKKQQALQRQAAIQMVGPDTQYGRALAEGADPEQVLSAYMQNQQLQQQAALAERGFLYDTALNQQRIDADADAASEERRFKSQQDIEARAGSVAQGEAVREALASQYEQQGNAEQAAKIRAIPAETFADASMTGQLKADKPSSPLVTFAGTGDPVYGEAPNDMVWARDEVGNLVMETDPVTGAQRPVAVPIGGTKQEAERQKALAEQEAAEARVELSEGTTLSRSNHVLRSIEQARNNIGPLSTGPIAQATSWIWGSPGANLEGSLSTVGANIAFDRLERMRAESPTGGALGNVTEGELKLLSSTIASLAREQKDDQLLDNLDYIEQQYKSIVDRIVNSSASAAEKQAALEAMGVGADDLAANDGWQDIGNGVKIRRKQ